MTAYLVNAIIIGVLIYLIYKRYVPSDMRSCFFPALGLKLFAGVALGLLYCEYYGFGDTIAYHQDAIKLSNQALSNISGYIKMLLGRSHNIDVVGFTFYNQPRAFFLVKILSTVHLLSGQNYWISGLYFSLFSFMGFWMLASTLVRYVPSIRLGVIVALLFFPSVVFWSSGIIKESIAMGALVLLIHLLIDWILSRKMNWKRIVSGVLLIALVWHLKYYYLGVFLVTAIPLIFTDVIVKNKLLKINAYGIYGALFGAVVILVSLLHPNFHLTDILYVIVENHDIYVLKSQQGQYIVYRDLAPTWWSIASNFPMALWSGLFRLGIWEANSMLEYFVGFEKLVVLIFSISAICRLGDIKKSSHKLLILTACFYTILLSGFLAMSAPNFGTLARYSVGYMPILLLLILSNNPLLTFLKSKFVTKVEEIVE